MSNKKMKIKSSLSDEAVVVVAMLNRVAMNSTLRTRKISDATEFSRTTVQVIVKRNERKFKEDENDRRSAGIMSRIISLIPTHWKIEHLN